MAIYREVSWDVCNGQLTGVGGLLGFPRCSAYLYKGGWLPVPLPWGSAGLGITRMHPSLLWPIFCFYFGLLALGYVYYRFLYMVEVLLVATCLMLRVCWGGVYNYV